MPGFDPDRRKWLQQSLRADERFLAVARPGVREEIEKRIHAKKAELKALSSRKPLIQH